MIPSTISVVSLRESEIPKWLNQRLRSALQLLSGAG